MSSSIDNTVAIVTPIHKAKLSDLEALRLQVSLSLNGDYKHYFVCPIGMPQHEVSLRFPKSIFVELPKYFFSSKDSYDLLMLNIDFYSIFSNFEYILILQSDAFLIKNIDTLISNSFDYAGAPFFPHVELRMSILGKFQYPNVWNMTPFGFKSVFLEGFNGGLSLRKIATFRNICEQMRKSKNRKVMFASAKRQYREDVAFSIFLKTSQFRLPPIYEALNIFHDSMPLHTIRLEKIIGFHALFRQSPSLEMHLLSRHANNVNKN